MCGGTPKDCPLRDFGDGLSPRVRGNLGVAAAGFVVGRSIPACAGEPLDSGAKLRFQRVYPRVCGGTCKRPKRRFCR